MVSSRQRHVANALAGPRASSCVNYRDHTPLSAGQVDDTPFGGGAGMVLRVDVVEAALRARYGRDPVELREQRRVIALTPAGRLLDDALVDELAAEPALTLLSGRYEGFDERILEHFASDQVSIGRYVLAGGELRRDGRSATPCCASFLARSGTRTRRSRSRSAWRSRAPPNTRTTLARRSIAAGRSPTCCCRATTREFARGVWPRARRAAKADGIAKTRLRYHSPLVAGGACVMRSERPLLRPTAGPAALTCHEHRDR